MHRLSKAAPVSTQQRRAALKAGASAIAALALAGHGPLARAAQSGTASASAADSGLPAADAGRQSWQNWSGIQSCKPTAIATPANETELAALLRGAERGVRCVGSGHSFTALVPTESTLVSLDRMSGIVSIDKVAGTVTLQAGTRLALVSRLLDAQGLAMRNLPDIDVQSFAGAIATGTHGTGQNLPALHADVIGMRLMTPDGNIVECNEQSNADLLSAARVSLGALGVLTQVTLRTVPAYNLHRRVFLKPIEAMLEEAPALAERHRNFEFYYLPFTGYAAGIVHDVYEGNDVLTPQPADEAMLSDLKRLRDWLGHFPKLRRWMAQRFIDADQTEEAKNRSWRLLATQRPTRFNETECHVPRSAGIDCVREVIATLEKRDDVYFPLEFRFVKGDDAWLSPFYQRDSCSIAVHTAHGEPYDYLLSEIDLVYRKYEGRPHWGKLHAVGPDRLAALYPRWNDFLAAREKLDPEGKMLNPYLHQLFGVNRG
ncbi:MULTISPECIES: D-arabinono-1,4-lactone oxidase [Ralstonia]|uniref:FAD-binding protein n=1 Tax=Ralstonia mojiangensis TaxID=2953895 RepID=A0AAE3LD65_9RALS|nr:D-arabinono-1,4-lactone oxidase [Ralstonia mojiangensis]MCO5411006.1 FAD-binding protein [Ralstonia mojiangensis]MCT7295412.1 FAD-binding protein [Ralstonia mojiangensis]MCT7313655.1 FAD-binding protein [Ralstonia mojiangensis]MCT7316236.1 FAD-binding protein [Ralstonia mojiangensis]MCT7325397.1 FAD-binding protein [Ralstonia mojiangensis]